MSIFSRLQRASAGRAKKELVHDEDYLTRAQARASIFEYIETFYNRVRRHPTLGYLSPVNYEAAQAK